MRKQKLQNNGFTLIEMIIYVSLFAVILFIIVRLFWQVQLSDVRGRTMHEAQENAGQVVDTFEYYVRKADDINTGSSTFGVHPGVLSIQDSSNVLIDTYTKNITLGGQPHSIRKLRLTEGAYPSLDLTSDHVDVTDFQLTNLTQGAEPDVILIDLTLSSLNPSSDELYDYSFVIHSSINLRKDS